MNRKKTVPCRKLWWVSVSLCISPSHSSPDWSLSEAFNPPLSWRLSFLSFYNCFLSFCSHFLLCSFSDFSFLLSTYGIVPWGLTLSPLVPSFLFGQYHLSLLILFPLVGKWHHISVIFWALGPVWGHLLHIHVVGDLMSPSDLSLLPIQPQVSPTLFLPWLMESWSLNACKAFQRAW